jgi:hypothetical protein
MTIDEAIDIAWGADSFRGLPRPTVQEALESIDEQLASCGFNWLTGQEAQRVLREACKQPPIPMQRKPMAKITLALDVEYDAQLTDPEALASAADRLMQTVLSTPGIVEEYGNPHFGEFYVARSAQTQSQPTVIVEVSGGVLQEAFADSLLRLVLLDWDVEGCEPAAENGIYQVGDEVVFVAEMPVDPIDRIVNTQTEKALQAAGINVPAKQDNCLQESRRWVLYSLNTDALLGTKVYSDYGEAVEDAAQLNDILVLPLVIQSIVM